ncbi:beta-lactamase family protein [Flavobacteriaceae bacterium F89]|uniref:Beta-lactamase family protein n=1 Tax=Cerina litoralis TaxID=2874477 RepID=A0AAE3EY17_9FLAO|nr:serine hydrolase [Cerina litoralis]MCG2461812.1 beta-lactamase family protein [Cerina litoralis]
MKNKKRFILPVFVIAIIIAGFYNYPKLNIISGYAAKNMASSVFIAHHSEDYVNANDNDVPLIKLAASQVDNLKKQATSTVFGLMKRTAVYREGLGSVLINGDYDPTDAHLKPNRAVRENKLDFPFGDGEAKDTVFSNIDYTQMQHALDQAFADPDSQKTRTVLVIYKDRIVAEKYIEGFSKETPILGWSMSKSILATLFGILEYRQKIKIDGPAPVPSWQNDDRKKITLNDLLRMQSGLAWDEDYTSISDVTQMLFLDTDMSKVQENKKALAMPGKIWNYSSGTTNLLSGILRRQFKSYQDYLDFPYNALIDKIGMHSMLLETDLAGNFVGSSYGWADTRDWAKFGLLYLHKGNWQGEQLFDPQWVDYVTKPTAHSNGGYGAHFWLNYHGKFPDAPKDMFSANGYEGQYVFIIPSMDLVIVRTGLAEAPDFDANGFLKEVLLAIK